MAVKVYNISLDAGADYTKTFLWKDSNGNLNNLTGYTARMKARPALGSSTTTLDMTTANGKIVLGGGAGTVQIIISSADSTTLTQPVYFYDLEVVSGGSVVTRLLEGQIHSDPEATK